MKLWFKGVWEWFILPLWFLKCYRLNGKLPDYCWTFLYFISNKIINHKVKTIFCKLPLSLRLPTYAFHCHYFLEIYLYSSSFLWGKPKAKDILTHFFFLIFNMLLKLQTIYCLKHNIFRKRGCCPGPVVSLFGITEFIEEIKKLTMWEYA